MVARRSVLGSARATVWTRRKFGSVYVSLGRMLGFSFGIDVALQVTDLLRGAADRPSCSQVQAVCHAPDVASAWSSAAVMSTEVTPVVRNGRACGDVSLF